MEYGCRYQVHGSAALACQGEERGRRHETTIIDYDIARRSYEARQRVERRKNAVRAGATSTGAMQRRSRQSQQIQLQDLVIEFYRPRRGVPEAVRESASSIFAAISSHPFVEELRYGSLKGKRTGNATDRQIVASGTVCMVLSAAIILIGA